MIRQHPVPPPDRLIPPRGMPIPDDQRAALAAGAAALGRKIDALKSRSPLWPDVEIFRKAVDWALTANTIYNAGELAAAREQLAEGEKRADALSRGDAYWAAQTGLIVRGYISKLDGSVQPYGLVVPAGYAPKGSARHRLDLFFHGRGETLTELSFLQQRMRGPGEFTPPNAFVLHPYGRFCNANHLAGEVDVFEALDHVRAHYRIDDDRTIVRGFSMGGASTWHLAVHHADRWAAAAPGAGFSETPDFVRAYANGRTYPEWQVQLWKLYDATDWPTNLSNLPTVAYDGDKDGQKQAADRMEASLKGAGMHLVRITGHNTGHWYSADGKVAINRFVDAAAAKGREKAPLAVDFTTWTLRYNRHYWVTVEGLGKHWQETRVTGQRSPSDSLVTLTTRNVTALSLHTPNVPERLHIDGQRLPPAAHYVRDRNGLWRPVDRLPGGLRKRPGLQGPIDDAFLESFVFVKPTGRPLDPALGAWVEASEKQAEADWRRYLRGDVRVVDDTKAAAWIKDANLVLWGDPQSNAVLRRIAPKLPLRWDASGLTLNGRRYGLNEGAPVLIFPNPLNPNRYVVLNTGFTFHDWGSDNNALHTPKLPDWAVLKVAPGAIQPLDAGFFSEEWTLGK